MIIQVEVGNLTRNLPGCATRALMTAPRKAACTDRETSRNILILVSYPHNRYRIELQNCSLQFIYFIFM